MKKITLLLMIAGLWMISCEKEEPEPEVIDPKNKIDYNYTTDSKKNILEISDGDSLIESQTYAFYADLEENASLKITLTNLSDYPDSTMAKATWFYSEKINWFVSEYENDQQTFTSAGSGKQFLDFTMYASPGKAKMELYENADTITKMVVFTWS